MRREVDEEFARYVGVRQHRLLRAAFLVCGDARLAQDLLEGALARLAARWDRLRGEDPDAYLRRTLYREAVSSWRHARRDSLHLHLAAPLGTTEPTGFGGIGDRIDLEQALEQLTARQRAVLVLRFFEDCTEVETAEALGLPTRGVRRQAQAALTTLRAVVPDLAHTGGDLP
ncbi:MAG TPA: sigma-70 family RNA polymerase sigma factor [Pedococcus sp.]